MASLTVRNLDEALIRLLRVRAAENGRSAEAEHREILRTALAGEPRGIRRSRGAHAGADPTPQAYSGGTAPARESRRAVNGSIVDASVAIKWFINEPASDRAVTLLHGPLAASDLLAPECASVLSR